MQILGLTGDIACGKSTVARWLSQKGAAVLDADVLVHELYAQSEFATQVQELFCVPIRNENGAVDRSKLGALVFSDAAAMVELEALVHPAVAHLRSERLRELERSGQEVVVLEAVKLLESGQGRICDEIWCVVCAPEVQLQRLRENRGLLESEALLRLQNQPSRLDKKHLALEIPLIWIENDGMLDELAALLAREWTRFLA